jgi:hypothetical protein
MENIKKLLCSNPVVHTTKSLNQKKKKINMGNAVKNGLPYEKLTDLGTEYEVVSIGPYHREIRFKGSTRVFIWTKQAGFEKYMGKNIDKTVPKAHGCKNPDEAIIDEENKVVFIIEKKFQRVSGSVCEKLQTVDCKRWDYKRTIPCYDTVYNYCLSDWFKENCKSELEYLEYMNVPVFWGNDPEYKTKIIEFILGYIPPPFDCIQGDDSEHSH